MVSALDSVGLRDEADIIRLAARRSIPLPVAEEYELWELAAACDMDLIGTESQVKGQELAEEKGDKWTAEYWSSEEGKARMAKMEAANKRGRKGRRR